MIPCMILYETNFHTVRSAESMKIWNSIAYENFCHYTAWDSEIESLTSLIKLHQNERRSAPCGQVGAAMQPPVLATSPTLKKFWVTRAFEVRWACTCCHDRAGFAISYHFLISVKSFELHERSKLDGLARALMIGRVLLSFTTFSFQSFLCFIGSFAQPCSWTLTQLLRTLNTSIKQRLDDTTTL